MQVDRLHAGLLRNGLTGEVNLEEGGLSLRYPQVAFDAIYIYMDISTRLDIYCHISLHAVPKIFVHKRVLRIMMYYLGCPPSQ